MLTFSSIRDIERAERGQKKLQRLPDTFFADLKDYIQKKDAIAEKTPEDMLELQNVKSVIRRLLELRESKIIEQAMVTARIGLPPEGLLKEEQDMFWPIVDRLKSFREQFFENLERKENMYRVKQALSEFVAPDMKTYKLNENDIVTLPRELAEFLKDKGVIEEAK